MRFIKSLKARNRKFKHVKNVSYALFECCVCSKEVERPLYNGLRNITCGAKECIRYIRINAKPSKSCTPIIATNILTNELLYFHSQMQCSRVLNIHQKDINLVLNPKSGRKTAKGYSIKYK